MSTKALISFTSEIHGSNESLVKGLCEKPPPPPVNLWDDVFGTAKGSTETTSLNIAAFLLEQHFLWLGIQEAEVRPDTKVQFTIRISWSKLTRTPKNEKNVTFGILNFVCVYRAVYQSVD